MIHQVSCPTSKIFHIFVLHTTYKTIWWDHKEEVTILKYRFVDPISHDIVELPDSAKVCRPPAATVVIRTPELNVTRQGETVKNSSPDIELSGSCLDDAIFLLFTASSPGRLLSMLETAPPVKLEPCDLGLPVGHLTPRSYWCNTIRCSFKIVQ